MIAALRFAWLLTFALIAVSLPALHAAEEPDQFRVLGAVAAEHPYLADPGLDSPLPVNVAATPEEAARGLVLFAKPATAVILPDYRPEAADRCMALDAADCPGQYGPVTFAVLALRDGRFTFAASGLRGPGGAAIGVENLDLRAVRYAKVSDQTGAHVMPLLLESAGGYMLADGPHWWIFPPPLQAGSRMVRSGRVQQFWITYYVPPGTPAGLYEGQVSILLDGAPAAALPLRLRVYPFELVEPDVDFYMYYGSPPEPAGPDVLYRWLVDQRCHGMSTGMVDVPVTSDGDVSRDGIAGVLDVYRRAGFPRSAVRVDFWNRITAEWLNTPDQSIGMWGPWFRYYPFTPERDERYVQAVAMLNDEAKARGLRLVLSVADEAGSHAWTIKATQHYNALIKERLPDVVRELTCGGGWAMGEPEHELWKGLINVWSTNRWLPDKLDVVRRDDPQARIELYNMAGAGSAAGGLTSARAVFGTFAWKARAHGVAQWVYWHSSTPEHNYVWPGRGPSEGPVPTLRWEAVREGTKDFRYLATLERRLSGKQGAVTDEARKFLDEVAAQVELRTEDYDAISGGRVPGAEPGTYDLWRSEVVRFIESLGPEVP